MGGSIVQASGEQYVIEGAGYRAAITEVGASLRELRHDGRDLVAPYEVEEVRPVFRGALLAPWPNRIADGRYTFEGTTYAAALNEPDRHNALHGLVAWSGWERVTHDRDRVVLRLRLHPQPAYPTRLDLTATYAVGDGGLTTLLEAVNAGDVAAPYGCAPHPYLVAGPGRVDDWTFHLDADRFLRTTPDRLLPITLGDVDDTPYDFRSPVRIGDRFVDHALTGLGVDPDQQARARLVTAEGTGVEISWDPRALPWAQVHTADQPDPRLDRAGLAVEPMTCPPDAFNSGTDLVVLGPGEHHRASWMIAAV